MNILRELNTHLLITGASGFLGNNLARFCAEQCTVSAQGNRRPACLEGVQSVQFDLSSETEVRRAMGNIDVQCVIHLAALTSPDDCDKDRSYAYRVNVDGTRHIVNYANDRDIPVIYISTDLVFDGEKGNYTEDDQPNPVSYYGETKLKAEEIVLSALDKNRVCRIALSYGKRFADAPGGFLDKFLKAAEEGSFLRLFTDQFRTPLYSGDFCEALARLIQKTITGSASLKSRIYHIGGKERVSRYEFGTVMSKVFGISSSRIIPVTMESMNMPAKRGRDCSLAIDRACAELGYDPGSIYENLMNDKKLRKSEKDHADINRH